MKHSWTLRDLRELVILEKVESRLESGNSWANCDYNVSLPYRFHKLFMYVKMHVMKGMLQTHSVVVSII